MLSPVSTPDPPLYEIPLGVPDQDRDQGQKQDPRQDRLAGEVTVELEALRDLERELEVVLG